jgi:lysophospholipase L1-like esterase
VAVVPVRAVALLAALLLAGAGAALAATPLAAVPIARLESPWWKARHEAKLAAAHSGPVDLVLLGDSITQSYESTGPAAFHDFRPVWQRFYGDRHALNLGFAGDATSHLLWRIEHGEIDGIAPKAAIILIGANNLGRLHWPTADDVLGIETVVAAVHRRLPATKILLLGVLPSDRGEWVLRTSAEINAALQAEYGRGQVPYVTFRDESPLFMKNGAVDTSLYSDPQDTPPAPALHPSPEGMARLAAAIEPVLSTMLGDRPHNR